MILTTIDFSGRVESFHFGCRRAGHGVENPIIIAGSDGRTISRAVVSKEPLIADIDKNAIAAESETYPVLQDLRPDLYKAAQSNCSTKSTRSTNFIINP